MIDHLMQYQYQINVGGGLFLTIGLTMLFLLMVTVWPNTLLKVLTLVFIGLLCAVMWRWIAAVLHPDLFGIKESLLAGVVFAVAGISTVVLAVVSWVEYVRDGRRDQ